MNVKAANNAKAITKAKAANKAKPIVTYNVNYIFQYNAYNVNSPCTNVIAINNKAYPPAGISIFKVINLLFSFLRMLPLDNVFAAINS